MVTTLGLSKIIMEDLRATYNAKNIRINDLQLSGLQKRLLSNMITSDNIVEGSDGYKIPIRTYVPKSSHAVRGIAYYIHGGGWRFGDLNAGDLSCRRLCLDTNAIVISVDYRLVPENPFPTPMQDVWDTYLWIVSEYPELPVVLVGSSAGGHLAAILAARVRDSKQQLRRAAGMLLRCPVTVHPNSVPEKHKTKYNSWRLGIFDGDTSKLMLTPEKMRLCHEELAVPLEKLESPEAYPLNGIEFTDLPKTYVQSCAFDILQMDALCYVDELKAAKVVVKTDVYQGEHTFWLKKPELPESEAAEKDMVKGALWLFED
ncbi:putative lipase/esterase [Geopyxis carbonaria]|nr:putative lipase/esterase [Geopyxis carbonaria]